MKLAPAQTPFKAYLNSFIGVADVTADKKDDITPMSMYDAMLPLMKQVNVNIQDASNVERNGQATWASWTGKGVPSWGKNCVTADWKLAPDSAKKLGRPVISGPAMLTTQQIKDAHAKVPTIMNKLAKFKDDTKTYYTQLSAMGLYNSKASDKTKDPKAPDTIYELVTKDHAEFAVCTGKSVQECKNLMQAMQTVDQRQKLFQAVLKVPDESCKNKNNTIKKTYQSIISAMSSTFTGNTGETNDKTFDWDDKKAAKDGIYKDMSQWEWRLQLHLVSSIYNGETDHTSFWPAFDTWKEKTEEIKDKFIEANQKQIANDKDILPYPQFDGIQKFYNSNAISAVQLQKMTKNSVWNQAQMLAMVMASAEAEFEPSAPQYYLAYVFDEAETKPPRDDVEPITEKNLEKLKKELSDGKVSSYRVLINKEAELNNKGEVKKQGFQCEEAVRKIASKFVFNGEGMKEDWEAVVKAITDKAATTDAKKSTKK